MRITTTSLSSKMQPFTPKAQLARELGKSRRTLSDQLADARLLSVAVETGARFVRERIKVDPLDWLFAKRELFGGRAAAESCREPEGFRRATVLHGLSLGLDAEPWVVRDIPAQEFLSNAACNHLFSSLPQQSDGIEPWPSGPPALYTCSISAELRDEHVQVFCAMIARDPCEVRIRLRQRYGSALEDEAQVRLGFDWSEPLACAMVSDAMAHVLAVAAADPASSFARGLDFQVEQRFVA